ncbi:MAG: hypothetical protein JW900_09520 [Anaerolineae bacterium]|nr:hypothetical protein [Anaerolineae bacterium]
MAHPTWFIPGQPAPPGGPLARYRPIQLSGVAVEYVRQFTQPGDVVVDLFCQGASTLREIVQAGRRGVGFNVNLVNLLLSALELERRPPPEQIKAAFTRLSDSLKGDRPLQRHIALLYRARCPACNGIGTAEWFAWDRDGGYPYFKAVRCPKCKKVAEGPADDADIEQAQGLEARGLAYHYALNRAIPADHPAREQAAELIELYTPRNLTALMDVVIRLEGLELERATRTVLHSALLSAFDLGSSLNPHGDDPARPRSLRLPARFLERNVWFLLEAALAGISDQPAGTLPTQRAAGLSALLDDPRPAYTLVHSAAREVRELLPPATAPLLLVEPPRPDGVFWALCALWASWLWEAPLAQAMQPFLRRRRFDWEWHRRALQSALAAVAPLLTPDGHLVILYAEPDEGLTESSCLAAAAAGYRLAGWGATAAQGVRLAWHPARAGSTAERPPKDPAGQVADAAAEMAHDCLQQRGEPTPWTVIHTAIYAGLADRGDLLAQAASPPAAKAAGPSPPSLAATGAGVRQGVKRLALQPIDPETDHYGSSALDAAQIPLADRVEEAAYRLLASQPSWETGALVTAIYGELDGPLTPALPLVLLCIDSYAVSQDGVKTLRPEDQVARRKAELKKLRQELQELGKRLGFRVKHGKGWDVRWQHKKKNRDAYLFLLSPSATLGQSLLAGPPIPQKARPCLVFPGGRAELLAYKLGRDPRLTRIAKEKGWEFIKFRHLRRLIAEGLDRRIFETVLGLDPIHEIEGVQIPLALDKTE